MEKVTDIDRAELIVRLMMDMETILCRGCCEHERCTRCQGEFALIARNIAEIRYGEA